MRSRTSFSCCVSEENLRVALELLLGDLVLRDAFQREELAGLRVLHQEDVAELPFAQLLHVHEVCELHVLELLLDARAVVVFEFVLVRRGYFVGLFVLLQHVFDEAAEQLVEVVDAYRDDFRVCCDFERAGQSAGETGLPAFEAFVGVEELLVEDRPARVGLVSVLEFSVDHD